MNKTRIRFVVSPLSGAAHRDHEQGEVIVIAPILTPRTCTYRKHLLYCTIYKKSTVGFLSESLNTCGERGKKEANVIAEKRRLCMGSGRQQSGRRTYVHRTNIKINIIAVIIILKREWSGEGEGIQGKSNPKKVLFFILKKKIRAMCVYRKGRRES